MSFLDAVVLGLVQGIAEFLPISSSGHLIFAREVLGMTTDHGLAVDAVLQLATACAVLLYFRTDIFSLVSVVWGRVRGTLIPHESRVLLTALVLGTIPAVILGLLLEHYMETIFRSATLVAWMLIISSFLLLYAERVAQTTDTQELTVRRGLCIGVFQTLALVPGVSRSGATISGGMILGLSRESAARFSFLLSLPIILGSGLKKLLDLTAEQVTVDEWTVIGVAALIAFVTGMASIHYLLRFLKNHTLVPFVVYRIALGVMFLLLVS
jgi:undecaprenyl-diphosphatase